MIDPKLAVKRKSTEAAVLEPVISLLGEAASPRALLQSLRELPHPSPEAVDDLEAAIADSLLVVRHVGAFE